MSPSNDGEDDTAGEPVDSLDELVSGDTVLWGDRVEPLVVIATTFGSHVVVEGPRGGVYTLWPASHTSKAKFTSANGGPATNLRRVEAVVPPDDDRFGGFKPGSAYREDDA